MMGKNKKKKAQMFSNFLAFKAGQGSQNAGNRTNVVAVNQPLPPVPAPAPQFQTPHGELDKLTELLDDNSPGAPAPAPASPSLQSRPAPSASKWRPVEEAGSIQVNIRKGTEKTPPAPAPPPHEASPPAPEPLAPLAPLAPAGGTGTASGKRRAPQWVLATPPAKQQTRSAAVLHNAGSGWPRSMSGGTPAPVPAAPLRVCTSLEGAAEALPPPQPYSPSDVYSETITNEEREECGGGEARRVSAFQRLGPAAPPAPPAEPPTPLRAPVAASTHETVLKYRDLWPHTTPIVPIRFASARTSKSAMLLQTEYMEETYSRDNRFVLVTVTGYPENWTKEDVLDAILESVKGKSFIPCFIEMSRAECRFLVVRSRAALLHIHKYGFVVRGAGSGGAGGGAELVVSLGCIQLTLAQLDFVPRLVLRRLTQLRLCGTRLDLSRFTREPDLSHFLYFPLWRATNQAELVQLQGAAPWADLTHLDLSHNNITSLSGLELSRSCPRLRALQLAHNRLASVTALLGARALLLNCLVLEGNPLCLDYIQQDHYLAVLTLLFPTLLSVDGVAVHKRGTLPAAVRQYSVSQSGADLAERLLSALLALLARPRDLAARAEPALLYHERATLRVTVSPRLRYSAAFVSPACRALFRCTTLSGRADITRALQRWPPLEHDPAALTLDVMHHSETATLLVVGGLARAPGEDALAFSRAVVVRACLGAAGPGALAVQDELLHWDLPAHAHTPQMKPQSFVSLDDPPDADLKQKLLTIFMQITELDKKPSERCLEAREWNIKDALEYFVMLLKRGDLEPIKTIEHCF